MLAHDWIGKSLNLPFSVSSQPDDSLAFHMLEKSLQGSLIFLYILQINALAGSVLECLFKVILWQTAMGNSSRAEGELFLIQYNKYVSSGDTG